MKKATCFLLLGALAVGSCQQAPSTTPESAPPTTTATPAASGAATEAAARSAVGRYLQGLPNAALYQVDSASVVDVDTHWQVLVPRTDWAGRMPNKAAFEVDKKTGQVSTRAVK
jgi:hypothetical protein